MYLAFKNLEVKSKIGQQYSEAKTKQRMIFLEAKMEHDRRC